MVEINKKLTPYNFTAMSNKKNQYIVMHYVGAVSSAENNAVYYAREKLKASAHYFVDEKSIWQSVEDSNSAWHCGGGLQGVNGHTFYGKCTNSNSIGIEMCVKKDEKGNWYFEPDTVKNTIDLVKMLMEKHKIPIDRVIRHFDVTGKICPAPYVDKPVEWDNFKALLTVQELVTPNDIVWELGHRGFVTDTKGMLDEMNQNPNGRLYWLARKMLHYIRTKK